jgi:hypothetical protein
VPYRARFEHLSIFVRHLHRFLSSYVHEVVVCEQAGDGLFNRGMLLNAGFVVARNDADWVCFHDVDMLPDSIRCDYSCPIAFAHLARCVEQFDYTCPYRNYIGGVLLATVGAFHAVNGFSNNYWGYGCEDDDLFCRIKASYLPLERRQGRYRSLPHPKGHAKSENIVLWNRMQRGAVEWKKDGLNSAHFAILCDAPLRSVVCDAGARDRHLLISLANRANVSTSVANLGEPVLGL